MAIKTLTSALIRKAEKELAVLDPKLAPWLKIVGKCTLNPKDWDLPIGVSHEQEYFHAMGRSIVFQQLSGKAATTIINRLLEKCPERKLSAVALKKLSDEEIQSAGISRQKLSYLRALQDCALTGAVEFAKLHELPDEKIIEELTRVKGIGTWTAEMFLLFRLGRTDILSAKDLGIQKGIQRAHALRKLPTPKQVLKLSSIWSPHRSVASWYFWRISELPAFVKSKKP